MRLTLIAATAESLDAELAGDVSRIAAIVGARVTEWPPSGGEWDREAMLHFRSVIAESSFDTRLGPFYVVREEALVANAGFFGPPDASSEVELGYSVCSDHRRQGVATAIVAELTQRASDLGCVSVRARVDPKNRGSITALLSNDYFLVPIEAEVAFVLLRRVLGSGPSSRAMA